jgi:hypothetical protein
MAKRQRTIRKDEILSEYDFSKGIRGKYAKRYAKGSNIIVLDPDVARLFPDSKTVNHLLRGLAEVVRKEMGKTS